MDSKYSPGSGNPKPKGRVDTKYSLSPGTLKGRIGAKPGFTVLRYWQGATEMLLRVIVLAFCCTTTISSSIALINIYTRAPSNVLIVVDEDIRDKVKMSYSAIITNSAASAGLGLGISIANGIAELILICLRFFNSGMVNYKIKIFFSVDIILSAVFAVIFFITGVLSTNSARQWRKVISIQDVLFQLGIDILLDLRDALAATAISSLLNTAFICILIMWMILSIVYSWNRKILLHNPHAHLRHPNLNAVVPSHNTPTRGRGITNR